MLSAKVTVVSAATENINLSFETALISQRGLSKNYFRFEGRHFGQKLISLGAISPYDFRLARPRRI